TLNKSTGAATLIGPLGFDANFGQAMDFDNDDGTLYLYAFSNTSFLAELRTANLSTGATTLVGTMGAGLQQIGAGSSSTELATVGCDLDCSATINGSTFNQGDVIQFNVTVTNTSASPVLAALRLVATGPANQTVNFGAATVPPGVTANRPFRVRIPGAAPNGSYNLTLELDADGNPCDTESFAITVTAPRVGTTGTTAFE